MENHGVTSILVALFLLEFCRLCWCDPQLELSAVVSLSLAQLNIAPREQRSCCHDKHVHMHRCTVTVIVPQFLRGLLTRTLARLSGRRDSDN